MQVMVGDNELILTVVPYIQKDLKEISRLWPLELKKDILINSLDMAQSKDFNVYDLMNNIEIIGDCIDDYYENISLGDNKNILLELLHPGIVESSFFLYAEGNYREAVLNSIIALFDYIRNKTQIDKDGSELIGEVFSLQNPILKLTDLSSETDRNIQKGFIQMIQGLYTGVRNPKAHSLNIEIDKKLASQYLVFTSLLFYKVEKAKK